MESESHSHTPVRPLDAPPKRHPDDDAAEPAAETLKEREYPHEPTMDEAAGWIGWKATDELGRSIGKVEHVYGVAGEPRWLVVRHKRSHHFLAPLEQAIAGGDQVFLPFDHMTLETAPAIDPDAPPDRAVIAESRAHYDRAASQS